MENHEHRRIWLEWHRASVERDQEALLSLYAVDAILEAPMIPRVLDQASGIIHGRENIRLFLERVRMARSSTKGAAPPMLWWREDHFFSAGETLMWEYPRNTPLGEQIDIVEVMKIKNGLIQQHRVYWGWKVNSASLRN